MSMRNVERLSSESSNSNGNESTASSSPEPEHEQEHDHEHEYYHEPEPEVEADSESDQEYSEEKALEMGNTQYTQDDPHYCAELTKACPPVPLFVLRWNRANNPRRRNWDSQNSSRSGNHGYDHNRQEDRDRDRSN